MLFKEIVYGGRTMGAYDRQQTHGIRGMKSISIPHLQPLAILVKGIMRNNSLKLLAQGELNYMSNHM